MTKAVVANASAVFGTAAYYNENAATESDWRVTNWGGNYQRLKEIKQKLDPAVVFSCRGCVGSEGGF